MVGLEEVCMFGERYATCAGFCGRVIVYYIASRYLQTRHIDVVELLEFVLFLKIWMKRTTLKQGQRKDGRPFMGPPVTTCQAGYPLIAYVMDFTLWRCFLPLIHGSCFFKALR